MIEYVETITNVCKGEPLGSFESVPDQAIIINGKIPPMPVKKTRGDCAKFYEEQARIINEILSESLPQATYDRLGIMFMQRKLSLYRGRTESAF